MRQSRMTWQYVAAVGWLVFTVALAVWWLIFGLSQARHLGALEGEAAQLARVTRMLVLEGVILVIMLVAGGVALLIGIRFEQRRRRDMRAFYTAFTHDLKTSMASLILQAEALSEDLPEAAGNPNLRRLQKDAVRLQLQLENALFLTESDAAVLLETIDIRSMVDALRDDWPELRIEMSGDDRVRADHRAFESVLRNLLQNAVVHGRATAVRIDARRPGPGLVEIVIADNGRGAPAEVTAALERPFTRTAATSGSGVGLYVCRGLLRQMHGRIELAPRPDGFTVALRLPGAA
jgi:signal transduction histidine kinase